MVAINWSFLCDYAFVDEKGRASIIRTFTFIHAPRLPIRYPSFTSQWKYYPAKEKHFLWAR